MLSELFAYLPALRQCCLGRVLSDGMQSEMKCVEPLTRYALPSTVSPGHILIQCDSHVKTTLQAVLTLFELGTLDNWGDTLFAAMDITGLDRQPRQNAQWQNAIFFIVFICVSAHFMIKSFVAVFCEQVRPSK